MKCALKMFLRNTHTHADSVFGVCFRGVYSGSKVSVSGVCMRGVY